MFYAIGTVAALDQAQDVESDREIDVERLDIGVGGGYRAADFGGIHRILGLENPVSVARFDFDDDEPLGATGHYIQLIVSGSPIDVQNAVAEAFQVLSSGLLPFPTDARLQFGHLTDQNWV